VSRVRFSVDDNFITATNPNDSGGVTYRNTAVAELIAGQVQLLVEPSALAVRLTQGPEAKVRAIAQLGPEADPALPGVPMLRDTHPRYVVTGWHGIWGPPGLPQPSVEHPSAALPGPRWGRLVRTEGAPRAGNHGATGGGEGRHHPDPRRGGAGRVGFRYCSGIRCRREMSGFATGPPPE